MCSSWSDLLKFVVIEFDLLVTVITFTLSIMYGVEIGLLIGVLIGLYPLLKAWTRPKIESSLFVVSILQQCGVF